MELPILAAAPRKIGKPVREAAVKYETLNSVARMAFTGARIVFRMLTVAAVRRREA